ncbi:MAG: SCO family protein [Smithellaceae bacterium]
MKKARRMKKILRLICLFCLFFAGSLEGHETLDTGAAATGGIGIDEKTGQTIPPGITFRDENGIERKLGDLLGKPVILTLVYYTCEHICPQMLEGLAVALPRLSAAAGKDYKLISVSFDDTDTPQLARNVKRNYAKAAGASIPEDAWRFLTADRLNIQRLTEFTGFHYRKDIHGFTHPVVLIFLSPQGKISRYFTVTKYQYGAAYPISFSSFDLNVALAEAAEGKPVTEIKRALLYCFSHEPPGQSKFYYFVGVTGLITLLAMVSFFIYLQVTSKRQHKDQQT